MLATTLTRRPATLLCQKLLFTRVLLSTVRPSRMLLLIQLRTGVLLSSQVSRVFRASLKLSNFTGIIQGLFET